MKKLLENFQLKWPTYLFEVIVLIVGIYGAFALESWNENNKERKQEQKFLLRIQSELAQDAATLNFMYNYRETSSIKSLALLELQDIEETHEAHVAFLHEVLEALYWWEFTRQDNTFQELISSGNLSILQNDSIKNGLLSIEALHKKLAEQRNHLRRDYEQFLYDEIFAVSSLRLIDFQQLISKRELAYLPTSSPEQIKEMNSVFLLLLSNEKFRSGLQLIILNNSYILELYDQLDEQMKNLQANINQQLAAH